MTQIDGPGESPAADVERRLAALRRLSGALAALTAEAESPGGTVRAVCAYGRGVTDLVIAPTAPELEGDRLPAVVQRTIAAATDEVHRRATGLLRDLRAEAREISAILTAAATPADPADAAALAKLREVWAAYQSTVDATVDVFEATSLERSP
ncbi:MAG TPA: hypothetical protein VHJ17_10235 [Thermomonospora sp.]|nr:hypothetical protein [Thermomonospora sp.]